MGVATNGLHFEAVRGEPLPAPQLVRITGAAPWSAETTSPWIVLSDTAGAGAAEVSVGIAAVALVGEITDSILIRPRGSTKSPLAVPVSLSQSAGPPGGVVFQRTAAVRQRAIYTMNADGSGVRRVREDSSSQIHPDVSPDGEWIVFVRSAGSDTASAPAIYKMRVDGSDVLQLTNSTDSRVSFTLPTWITGEEIGFRRSVSGNPSLSGYLLMNADGSNVRELGSDHCLNYSPGGGRIACVESTSGEQYIYITDLRTAEKTRIYTARKLDGYLAEAVAWSPDGREIAFSRGYEWDWDVYVLDLETRSTRRLTDTREVVNSQPSWSPDGTRILFSRFDVTDYVDGGLHSMDPDGRNVYRLTGVRGDLFPGWIP